VLSRDRVLPKTPGSRPQSSRLSIIDATVINFAPTAALWVFDSPLSVPGIPPFSTSQLLDSFRKALDEFPHWAGQLQWAPSKPGSSAHHERHGRLMVAWNTLNDPGAEFAVAHSPMTVASAFEEPTSRNARPHWQFYPNTVRDLTPAVTLALNNHGPAEGVPAMAVQCTTFACGGLVVAVKLAHPLGDAQSVMQFMGNWTALNQGSLPTYPPLFNPPLLDGFAGNSDSRDPGLIETADALPMLRYDYWASGKNCPAWAQKSTEIPLEIPQELVEPFGQPIPWCELDTSKSVKTVVFHFSGEELQCLINAEPPPAFIVAGLPASPSRMTTLLGHIWRLILRARCSTTPSLTFTFDLPAHLTLAMDLRPRLSPPLPPTFVGSPIANAAATWPPPAASTAPPIGPELAPTASNLSDALARALTAFREPPNVTAALHRAVHAASPQRYWDAFLGQRHTMVTTWTGMGLQQGDAGAGVKLRPRMALPVMPAMDGLICLFEAGGVDAGQRKWYDSGVDVMVSLEEKVMDRLVEEGGMHTF
ncbi:hypothetical protein BDY21DRAFT_266588, partial [Lineolata rhizophorae]